MVSSRNNLDGSQTEADLTFGNRTEAYYLYDDIADLISSYSITELYKMLKDNSQNQNTGRAVSTENTSVLETGNVNLQI